MTRQSASVEATVAGPLAGLLRQAAASCEAGQFQQAEFCCQQALRLAPGQPDALHILGLIALQTGRHQQAWQLFADAIAASPVPNPLLLLRQAIACQALGRLDEAVAGYRRVLEQQPGLVDAWNNLGRALRGLGQLEEAEQAYARAIALQPGLAAVHFNRGQVQQELRQLAAAEASFRQALALQADLPEAWLNLSRIFRVDGRYAEAEDACRQALRLRPQLAVAHFQLGEILRDRGRYEDAVSSFSEGLRYLPQDVDAWIHLGGLLRYLNRLEEADRSFRQAIALSPDHIEAHQGLAWTFMLRRRFREMEACHRKVLSLEPQSLGSLCGLGEALYGQDRPDEAVDCFRQAAAIDPELALARRRLGDALTKQGHFDEGIASYEKALELEPGHAAGLSSLLMCLQYSPRYSAADIFAAHQRYGALPSVPPRSEWPRYNNTREPGRRLRLGYVSADFFSHSVAFFFEPILALHDRSQLEIFCYSNSAFTDSVTERIRGLADHWCYCLPMSEAQLSERIQADGIDILVDLSGHSSGNRLLTFARKPAPVQVTWIGYPGTTGLEAMDYRLTDAFLDPPGMAEAFHTETLVRLPAWATFKPEALSPPVNALPALTRGHITLACLNNLVKVNTAVVALWARLLRELPSATLLLGNAGQPEVKARLEGMFAAAGIGPERLRLVPKLPLADYLALHHEIDIALDPFPFTGGVTTHHALWMGVPVITLAGETTISRQGSAILNSIGLGEFVARSADEYVEKVLALARDPERLDAIRQGLRERIASAPAPDAPQLTRALEQAYREMWAAWCTAS